MSDKTIETLVTEFHKAIARDYGHNIIFDIEQQILTHCRELTEERDGLLVGIRKYINGDWEISDLEELLQEEVHRD